MLIPVLKAKLHLCKVTGCLIDYEGSCAIDYKWMEDVGLRKGEQIHIFNQNNGERFVTYAIPSDNAWEISLNGAAARKAMPGDRIIIVSYALITPEETIEPKIKFFKPCGEPQ